MTSIGICSNIHFVLTGTYNVHTVLESTVTYTVYMCGLPSAGVRGEESVVTMANDCEPH